MCEAIQVNSGNRCLLEIQPNVDRVLLPGSACRRRSRTDSRDETSMTNACETGFSLSSIA